MSKRAASSGIETDQPEHSSTEVGEGERVVRVLKLTTQHHSLTQVTLSDVTDRHNELVQENQWLLHTCERLALSGNLFVLEDLVTNTGQILVKCAPLPHARPVTIEHDLRVNPVKGGGFEVELIEADGVEDSWTILTYDGSVVERTRVLHEWQSGFRPDAASHTRPRFISNTWGDRSRDSRIQQDFLEGEIEAAQELGVDVVQIDDGWQRGVTSNSALAKERGGVWEGFWNADPNFWAPHPERLPNGLEPLIERVQAAGMGLGLWFAPDSWNDFENWERDVDTILGFYRDYGIEHIKIDGVKARTDASLNNLKGFFDGVLAGSGGNVVFDLDVTAEVRPGYFGAMQVGPLFVENRYTDFHRYWPHQTFRNLWHLARWIDPKRLRMEFLNHKRNTDLYAVDPLAPEHYDPEALFATVMFANPLGWFEVTNLPDGYRESAAKLVSIWKAHRDALFGGTILSVGAAPDGFSYTGFVSVDAEGGSGYALLFRFLDDETGRISLPGMDLSGCRWEILASNCEASVASDALGIEATVAEALGYVFARYES